MNSRHLQLYLTTDTPCSYFDERVSRNLVPDPEIKLNMPIYNQLISHGFRRSGGHCYRPHCRQCDACVACRIPVNNFSLSRSQRRCLNTNQDLTLNVVDAVYSDEYFTLYRRYLNARHEGGSMANPEKKDFKQFLFCDWCDTEFLELRSGKELLAVAVTDRVSDGLSAVYSFFDPDMPQRSLGTHCILMQIEYARRLKLGYIYLGYWIDQHEKMHYKKNFKPMQFYVDEQWQTSHTSATASIIPEE